MTWLLKQKQQQKYVIKPEKGDENQPPPPGASARRSFDPAHMANGNDGPPYDGTVTTKGKAASKQFKEPAEKIKDDKRRKSVGEKLEGPGM